MNDPGAAPARPHPATPAGQGDEAGGVRSAVRAVRDGDRNAFRVIVDRYERRLFGLTLMLVRNPAAAEELAQDALVRAYANLHAYEDARPFYPWLATIVVRLSQNWLRQQSRLVAREGAPLDVDPAAPAGDGPLDALVDDERARRLWREVAGLSSGQRAAVMLFYRDGLTVSEVAAALGVTSGTVKTLLFRARRALRESLTAAGWRGTEDP
ncbi:MAG: RNA polymerase sigma factor [Vicinamibacterales bacterium]